MVADASLLPQRTSALQAVSRRVAHHTFAHVLDLDITFHLERRTGRLSRILERGTRSTQMLFRAVVFTLLPTALELALVCGTLGKLFNGAVVASVFFTFACYVVWTTRYIELSAQVRRSSGASRPVLFAMFVCSLCCADELCARLRPTFLLVLV